MKSMKCKNCNGTGHIFVVLAKSKFDLSVIHCSSCGGRGIVTDYKEEGDEGESLNVFR